MTATHHPQQFLHGQPLTLSTVLLAFMVPAVSIATLLLCAMVFGQTLSGPYLILSIIVFSVTFSARLPQSSSLINLAIKVLINWCWVAGLLLLLGWATQTLDVFDRRVILAWIITTPIALFAAQILLPLALPRVMAAEGVQRLAVIAGGGLLGQQLATSIQDSPSLGIRIAGYFEDRGLQRGSAEAAGERLGSIKQLPAYAKSHPVDLIYITLPMASQPRILRLLYELRDTTASIYFTPDIFLADLIQARVDTLGGMPVIAICETPFYGINGMLKRASDIVLAALILILIAPLMLAIAGVIKLQSPGPALFKQRRYGLDGREIVVYKFRSMTVAEDGDEIRQATVNDSRVTPFGAFLRRTSLDELPQFINVLQGRMSVVGPRPHAVAHNELYRKLINGYMVRHKVRPGITGWAQVNGHRGETDTLDKMQKRIEFDLAYLRDWSLPWDLEIIFKTLFVVFKKQNAY
jgi:putative colanic acid biosynthesis UDP-glucose lipid carrier transferase